MVRRRPRRPPGFAAGSRTCSHGRRSRGTARATIRPAGRATSTRCCPSPARSRRPATIRPLALGDAAAWFADVRKRKGISARALEFLTLTAARSGEVRGAAWGEIDLKARLWTIPAARMKAAAEHRVALTPEAVELLEALPRFEGGPLVFAAARGGQLSDMTLSAVMRKINEARPYIDLRSGRLAVPHGLRSTFRDWAAEAGYARDMAEIALAHVVGSEVERAYRRSDMLERRRAMMAAWAALPTAEAGGERGADREARA